MKIGIISFTNSGCAIGNELRKNLLKSEHQVWTYTKSKFVQNPNTIVLEESLQDWTRRMFADADAVIFIGACGIAVRSIAPFVKDKKLDPAVLVIDEKGTFCISLLSGHIGGANELCREVSIYLDAVPVITTATDINDKFAVDVFAVKNDLYISNMTYAKEVAARLVAGKKVLCKLEKPGALPVAERQKLEKEGVCFLDFRQESAEMPKNITDDQPDLGLGIYVGIKRREKPFTHTLYLTPKVVTVGLGCRRGTKVEAIQEFMEQVILAKGISFHSIKQVATIDLKKNEKGLLEYCERYKLPLQTYDAESLKQVKGEFTPSDFVSSITGVDNVCERSAVLGSNNGTLILKKTAANGMTVALAVEEWSLRYE